MRCRVGAVLLVDIVGLLDVDGVSVERVALIVYDGLAIAGGGSRLEHAEAERLEPGALPGDASMLRARDDVVPRRREQGRDLVLDRPVRLVVGREERPDLGVGREAVAEELDGTRLRAIES